MKKRVKFEKWTDPLNSNLKETEWAGERDEEEYDEIKGTTFRNVMHTPFGLLTLTDSAMAATHFDFWWMHTNFDITNEFKDVVKQVQGVETLEIYTRYRARVGFPKSGFFITRDVMGDIQKAITNHYRGKQNQLLTGLPTDIAEGAITFRDAMDDKYESWAMLILPNGNIESVTTDVFSPEFKSQIELLNQTKNLIGGRLLTSET